MRNRLIILGAGGHGKVLADMALKNGYEKIAFLDDRKQDCCLGYPVLGKVDEAESYNDGQTDFVIAVGDNAIRETIARRYALPWATLIHPSAQIGIQVHIGEGTVIMAGAVINADTNVGKHCIINTRAVVEHDNALEDYVHISPNVALGGTVCIGKKTHIGIGATVKNNVEICENCIVGAGAVVVKNISSQGVYVGLPAKLQQ